MYYQLCTRTCYSFSHSSVLPEEYAQRAKALGYSGIGVSDLNLYAYPSFADACQKEGLKPLFGYEISLASSRTLPFTAYLYIKNETGYRNLCEILARKEETLGTTILSQYHEGLLLILGTNEDFYSTPYLTAISPDLLAYSKIFGDDFYIGLSFYSNLDKEEAVTLYDFLSLNEYKSVAFPKVCYLKKKDAYKTELLERSRLKQTGEDIPEEGPYFLLSEKALKTVYREQDLLETIYIADKLNFSFFEKRGAMITFGNDDDTLKKEAQDGLEKRLDNNIPKEYQERLDYELSVIKKMNFSSYFLIVQDYVRYARDNGIKVGPGRGSAGGSLVAYALYITEVDPIRFDLTFERFLNPNRKTMPDIDIDFIDTRRDEVANYLSVRYGKTHTATIITFPRLKPKSCLNLIGPALNFNDKRLKNLTREIDDKASTFEEALASKIHGSRFQKLYADPYYRHLCDIAESLLGIPYTVSIHAPGVILSKDEIYHTCPMSEGKYGTVGYEYPYMERMGFLKMDILSLSNLSFLDSIEKRIQARGEKLPDIYNDLDNPKVYQVLNRLELTDIFQLDASYLMRKTVEQIHPTSFTDMTAIISLCRPGPMAYIDTFARRKKGEEPVTYIDERLKPILKETYGIMVYQEQIMKVVQVAAGFSLGDADLFRRAISKKDLSKMEDYKEKFYQGCLNNGISQEKAEALFADIEKFAQYGFNKAHAYAYSLITYSLLYYKTFYPMDFYEVALKGESLGSEKMSHLLSELKSRRKRLRNPNLLYSDASEYVFKGNDIYLPLSSVNGYSAATANAILEERKKSPFTSFYDFALRLNQSLKKDDMRFLLALIDAGAFDSFSKSRLAMKQNLELYLSYARMGFKESDVPSLKDDGEDIGEMLYLEKMALGRILSVSLSRLYHKEGYMTLLVSDTSMLELSHVVEAESEDKRYHIQLKQSEDIQKYDFLLVQVSYKSRSGYLYPTDVINMKRKVISHG